MHIVLNVIISSFTSYIIKYIKNSKGASTMTEKTNKQYPRNDINMLPGDILYSTIGRSTYFVGHTVIVGTYFLMKESIPGKPSGYMLTAEFFWNRHRRRDGITLLRSKVNAGKAAICTTENLHLIKDYQVLNTDSDILEKNYCSKWVVQAYYYGTNVKLADNVNRFISPQYFK